MAQRDLDVHVVVEWGRACQDRDRKTSRTFRSSQQSNTSLSSWPHFADLSPCWFNCGSTLSGFR